MQKLNYLSFISYYEQKLKNKMSMVLFYQMKKNADNYQFLI